MPLTFLSHQAVVLPFKIRAPRWFSGTALVLGSMAPDVEYFLRGYPTTSIGHTWLGQLTFCLPVTLVLFWLVTRWIAEPAAVHTPDAGLMHIRDYALLRQQPRTIRHWAIVVGSALLGSSSHVVLDDVLDRVGGRPYYSLAASPAWMAVNVLLWLVLAWITVGLLRYIGRHRLVQRWALHRSGVEAAGEHPRGPHPPASPSEVGRLTPVTTPARFWGLVLFCAMSSAGLGAHYRRPGYFMHQGATWIHIWLISVGGAFTGLLLASITWKGTRARPRNLERGQ